MSKAYWLIIFTYTLCLSLFLGLFIIIRPKIIPNSLVIPHFLLNTKTKFYLKVYAMLIAVNRLLHNKTNVILNRVVIKILNSTPNV